MLMTYRFKVLTPTCKEVWRSNTVLDWYIRRGVKVTHRRGAVYVHLGDECAYTVLINWLEDCQYKGLLIAPKKAMAWLSKYTR